MPLHLLGKKSWNVYSPANIARVKADEAAAAANELAEEQRMQERDAQRRAAILRGHTPPLLPEDGPKESRTENPRTRVDNSDHDRKRRRLAGEDDTDRDIRLAKTTSNLEDNKGPSILHLRGPRSEAPLVDHAGNINLFPVDTRGVGTRDKNVEAEREKKRREQLFEDQYTMRLSNAAGRQGPSQPWYTRSGQEAVERHNDGARDSGFRRLGYGDGDASKVDDARRKDREQACVASNDPLAFMNQAQVQLKRSRQERKRWAEERERELKELRADEENERKRHSSHRRRERHKERRTERDYDDDSLSRHKHRKRSRSRSRSRSPAHDPRHRTSHRHEKEKADSRSRRLGEDRKCRDSRVMPSQES